MSKATKVYATREDIDEVIGIFRDFMQQVDERFNGVDMRLDGIEHDIAQVKSEVADLRASHDRLLNTIDGFVGRIDRYEVEQAARDSQFQRLLEWAKKVSEETGIPLDGF